MWNIMKYMSSVASFSKSQDPLKSRHEKPQFIEQAKKYLEDRFVTNCNYKYFIINTYTISLIYRYKEFMSTVIKDHLREAQRGGVPSTYNLVNAFVGYKFKNQNTNSIMGKRCNAFILI